MRILRVVTKLATIISIAISAAVSLVMLVIGLGVLEGARRRGWGDPVGAIARFISPDVSEPEEEAV